MRRREFVAGLGSAAAWPVVATAQQGERVRRIGMLLPSSANDRPFQQGVAVFRQELASVGWIEGRNLRIEARFAGADADRFRAYALELIGVAPDVIVTVGAAATRAAQQLTQTIPIVFINAGDPVTNGIVKNIARPEGNTTGVTGRFASIGGKSLEFLKEASPRLESVGLIYNAQLSPENNFAVLPPIEEAARASALHAIRIPYSSEADITNGVDAFARQPNGGLIVLPPPPTALVRETIRHQAIQHRLPAIYTNRDYVTEGGLMSYGANYVDVARRSSSFVDRILRGAKPGDLPIEYPIKFELVINLKTAKAIGLAIPPTLLSLADEVIE
jgi:putative tryptophan/tyrosine transport system substrate-binding protein